jgi:hypothetical protein
MISLYIVTAIVVAVTGTWLLARRAAAGKPAPSDYVIEHPLHIASMPLYPKQKIRRTKQ